MTNTTIIYNAISNSYNAEEIHNILLTVYTEDQIKEACAKIVFDDDAAQDPDFDENAAKEACIASELFHTFQFWKKAGFSVKKGEHAAITCYLWKWTDKATKAEIEAAKALPEGMDQDPEHNPHFYKAKSHLFHIGQVKPSDKEITKSDYNKMLKDQRVPV